MGALKWGLKVTLGNLRTIVYNCAHLWPFGPVSKQNFRRKMTTIVGNRGQLPKPPFRLSRCPQQGFLFQGFQLVSNSLIVIQLQVPAAPSSFTIQCLMSCMTQWRQRPSPTPPQRSPRTPQDTARTRFGVRQSHAKSQAILCPPQPKTSSEYDPPNS